MNDLTIDDVLAISDADVQRVECPELGGVLYCRALTIERMEKIEAAKEQGRALAPCLIGYSLCDKHGKFSDISDAQIDALGGKSYKTLKRLCEVVLEHNQLNDTDLADAATEIKKTD